MRQINFSVDDRVYAALEKRAHEHGYKATGYAKMLFEAAFASRVGFAPDADLDDQIALAVVLHGAKQNAATISKATKLSESTVLRVIDAWRQEKKNGHPEPDADYRERIKAAALPNDDMSASERYNLETFTGAMLDRVGKMHNVIRMSPAEWATWQASGV